MKKMAEIMDELGFRPDASDEVKKAFIKNLIKAANASEFKTMKPELKSNDNQEEKDPDQYQQISLFDQKIPG